MSYSTALKEELELYKQLDEEELIQARDEQQQNQPYQSRFVFGKNEVRYALREHYKALGFGEEGVDDKKIVTILGGMENILEQINSSQSTSFDVGSKFDITSRINFYRGEGFCRSVLRIR